MPDWRQDRAPRPLVHILLTASMLTAAPALAGHFSFDTFLGAPLNFDSTVEIRQNGEPELEFEANWETQPFRMPFYWDVRLAYWTSGECGWAIDFFHHKLIASDPSPEVNYFEHTHGYNLLTAQRLWLIEGYLVSLGAGVVIVNPENRVRGQELRVDGSWLGGGYHISGTVGMAGVGRRFYLGERFFGALEGRITASRVTAPVFDGEATMGSVSLHGLFGVGVDF